MRRERWSLGLLAVAVALHASVWPSLGLAWTRPGAWALALLAFAALAVDDDRRRAAASGAVCLVVLVAPLVATAVAGHLDPSASMRLDGIEVGPWPGRVLWMTGLFAVPVAGLVTLSVRRGALRGTGALDLGLFVAALATLLTAFSAWILWGLSAQVPALVAGWVGHGLVVYELAGALRGDRLGADPPTGAASEA